MTKQGKKTKDRYSDSFDGRAETIHPLIRVRVVSSLSFCMYSAPEENEGEHPRKDDKGSIQ